MYISILPQKSIDDDFLVLISGRAVPRSTVTAADKVLTVDVEAAWKEMKVLPGWSNEIMVEVLMDW